MGKNRPRKNGRNSTHCLTVNALEIGTLKKNNRNIPKKHLPFFLHWTKLFIRFCQSQDSLGEPEKMIGPFLIQIDKRFEQWQVDQAKEALNLYCFFTGTNGSAVGPASCLSVKDLDFQRNTITVRAAKGNKDRRTLLPENTVEELKLHLDTHVARKNVLGVCSPLDQHLNCV